VLPLTPVTVQPEKTSLIFNPDLVHYTCWRTLQSSSRTADTIFPCQENDPPWVWEYLPPSPTSTAPGFSGTLCRLTWSGARPLTLLTFPCHTREPYTRADGAEHREPLYSCLLHYPELRVSFLRLTFRGKSKAILETS